MGHPWGAFCQITLTSCYERDHSKVIQQRSYIVWNFHSNWLIFLRVMQETERIGYGFSPTTRIARTMLRQDVCPSVCMSVCLSILHTSVLRWNLTRQNISSNVFTLWYRAIILVFTTPNAMATRGQSNLTKSASRGPIPRLGVTPGGRNLYHWIPGVGVPISVP